MSWDKHHPKKNQGQLDFEYVLTETTVITVRNTIDPSGIWSPLCVEDPDKDPTEVKHLGPPTEVQVPSIQPSLDDSHEMLRLIPMLWCCVTKVTLLLLDHVELVKLVKGKEKQHKTRLMLVYAELFISEELRGERTKVGETKLQQKAGQVLEEVKITQGGLLLY